MTTSVIPALRGLTGRPSLSREVDPAVRESALRTPSRLPGPQPRWLSGNLQDYENDRLRFLEACRGYGGLARFDSNTTVVNDAEIAARILDGPQSDFRQTENFLGRKVDPDSWSEIATLRRLLNPHLRSRAVAAIPELTASLLEDRLDEMGGDEFDPLPILEHVLPSAVVVHFLGTGSEILLPQLRRLLDALGHLVGNPWALPAFTRGPVHRRIDRHYRDLHSAVLDALIAGQRDPSARGQSVGVKVLGAAASHGLAASRVADLLIGAMLASIRVPAASTGWLLMLLADSSDVQYELRARVPARTRGSGRVAVNVDPASGDLPLWVCMESLRLFPATWLITRTAAQEIVLGDVAFAEGHHFLISPFALHRDPRAFPRPHSFLPERWQDLRPTTGSYVPFGRGLGRCPGRDLATSTMVHVLLMLASRWHVDRRPGLITADPRTTLMPRGLEICLAPRATRTP